MGHKMKDVKKFLIILIEEQGASVFKTKDHYMVYNPNGVGKFLVSSTTGSQAFRDIVKDAYSPVKGQFVK